MGKKIQVEAGRTIVADGAIPDMVHGTLGPCFEWVNPSTGIKLLFIWVYGIAGEAHLAWGEIMIIRQREIDFILSLDPQTVFALLVMQADPVKSAARPGGLRPSGQVVGL